MPETETLSKAKIVSKDFTQCNVQSRLPLTCDEEVDEPHAKDVPWLGLAPPDLLAVLPVERPAEGAYRMWCRIPPQVSKTIVYRHYSRDRMVFIGFEFEAKDEDQSMLLGHRSL